MIQCEVGSCLQQQYMACQPCRLWQLLANSPQATRLILADHILLSWLLTGQVSVLLQRGKMHYPVKVQGKGARALRVIYASHPVPYQALCNGQGQCCAVVLVTRHSGHCHDGLLAAFRNGRCSLLMMDCPPSKPAADHQTQVLPAG